MSKHEPNPYFALLHGSVVALSDIERKASYTMPAVDTYLQSENLVGQITLPFDGEISDVLLWSPTKRREREIGIQSKLDRVRAELKSIGKRVEFEEPQELIELEAELPVDIH
jgi:hypothetical protein